jgi:hypothetical protein
VQTQAGRYAEAIAACDRGLQRVTGPLGRSWLERTRAEAMIASGDSAGGREWLEKALASARAIGNARNRDNNMKWISQKLAAIQTTDKSGSTPSSPQSKRQ